MNRVGATALDSLRCGAPESVDHCGELANKFVTETAAIDVPSYVADAAQNADSTPHSRLGLLISALRHFDRGPSIRVPVFFEFIAFVACVSPARVPEPP